MIYITCRRLLDPSGTEPSHLVKSPKSFIYIFNISKSSKLAREKDILSILNIGLIFHFFLIGIHGYIDKIMLNPNDKATSNIMIDFDLGQKIPNQSFDFGAFCNYDCQLDFFSHKYNYRTIKSIVCFFTCTIQPYQLVL